MKITLLTLISILLFWGCNKSDKTSSEQSDPVKTEKKDETTASNISKEEGTAKDISKTTDGIEIHKFDKNNLPSTIKYQGKIVDGAYWTDKEGDNIIVITQSGIRQVNSDIREQYLYAYQYINHDDGYSQLWNITDFVKSYCDVEAEYIPGTLEIVDLDGDNIGESLFLYKLDDRCDVSPMPLKLMMHSGDTKLVIRGSIGVDAGGGYKVKGEKDFDAAFKNVAVKIQTVCL